MRPDQKRLMEVMEVMELGELDRVFMAKYGQELNERALDVSLSFQAMSGDDDTARSGMVMGATHLVIAACWSGMSREQFLELCGECYDSVIPDEDEYLAELSAAIEEDREAGND